jgi:response regulator NasT
MRILIAEDESIIRLDLRRMLERAGYEVCAEARNGAEAVQLARETEPEAAVIDVRMPELSGIEAVRRILAERSIPIVMLTAYSDPGTVTDAIRAGVFAYVVKPFREQDLLRPRPLAGTVRGGSRCGDRRRSLAAQDRALA